MCAVSLLVVACGPELVGQSFTATVTGIITDPSAAVIPEAEIRVTNSDTNVSSTGASDSQGRYLVSALQPGRYVISVKATGFKELVRSGIRLEVDQRLRLDFVMEVGAVTEQVLVTAAAPLVDREKSSLGSVVANWQIVNVPLNGRNSVQLAALVPGVILGRGFSDENNSSASVFINGGRGNASEILVDGISAVTPANNPINVLPGSPPVDAIQEFKVQTNNLSAEFGRTGGGVLNFVFKSGTNELHGSVFEFLRNSRLDANDFFGNREGIPLASFRRNQFGGTVGGPVVIPHLINGRDKVFFFASYEGLRESTRTTETHTFPTAAERAGDFSQTFALSGGNCQPVNIFDPFSTRSQPGGGFIRTQFQGNKIPPSAFDPVAQRLVAFYPLPKTSGDPCTGANNFTASGSSTSITVLKKNKPM
jgi:hypothetical protein